MSLFKIGNTIHHFDTLDSTNNYAANVFKSGVIKCGTVILADNQTNGRGQRDNSWNAEPHANLTFSFVISSEKLNSNAILKPILMSSIGLVNFLQRHNTKAQIKWPNDIMVNNKKIAGILIENFYTGKQLNFCVVGIGLNINQTNFDGLSATSLVIEKGNTCPLQDMLESVIHQLNLAFNSYHHAAYAEVLAAYNALLWKKDQIINFVYVAASTRHEGIIKAVDSEGRLHIEMDGEVKMFRNGEVKIEVD
jgi:BirA family biotin operon repressor/biotin-[acetyl-CoA-carboxylase] ligase